MEVDPRVTVPRTVYQRSGHGVGRCRVGPSHDDTGRRDPWPVFLQRCLHETRVSRTPGGSGTDQQSRLITVDRTNRPKRRISLGLRESVERMRRSPLSV